jgi:hypothetical protein
MPQAYKHRIKIMGYRDTVVRPPQLAFDNAFNSEPTLIEDTIIMQGNTALKNANIKLAAGTNKNMVKNESFSDAGIVISSLTNASVNVGGTLAVLATVTAANHGKVANDYVFVNGVTPQDYNGIWKVYDVPTVNTLRYIMAYDVGDAISAGAGIQLPYIQTVDTFTTNSINATAASTAVTGTGFIAGAEWVGKSIATVISGVFTVLGVIQSVTNTTTMTLVAGSAGTVAGGKWTILNPAGMRLFSADYDITIDNCYFDYDFVNQSSLDNSSRFGIYLRRVKKLNIINLDIRNVPKYALCLANCYDVTINGVTLDTLSDGIHFLGSGGNITVSNVQGKTGDDCVAFGQSDFYQYLDNAHAHGDFDSVVVRNIKPKFALSCVKYYGCANTAMNDIKVSEVGGKISGGSGHVIFLNDSVVVGAECGGAGGLSKIRRADVDVNIDQNSSKPAITLNSITIENCNMQSLVVGLGNTAGTSNGVLMSNGSRINDLVGGTWRFFSSTGAFHANATGWYMDGTSMVLRANIGNMSGANIGKFMLNNCTVPTVEHTCIWTYGSVSTDVVDFGCQSAGRITLEYGIVRKRQQSGSNTFWSFSDFSILKVGSAAGLDGLPSVGIATGKNVQLNCPDVGFDLTNTGGAAPGGTVVGQRNSSFFHMSATAAGTLQRYNPVYYEPTTAKWVQMTNTTLTN